MEIIKLTPITNEKNVVTAYKVMLNAHMSNTMLALASISDSSMTAMLETAQSHSRRIILVLSLHRRFIRNLSRQSMTDEEFVLSIDDARVLALDRFAVDSLNMEYAFKEYNLENTLNLLRLLSLSSFVSAIATTAVSRSIGSLMSKEEVLKMN
jgi:hypothetical protein